MRRAILLLLLSASVIPASGQDSKWGFAPPDATVFAGVEWAKLRHGLEPFLRAVGITDKSAFDLFLRMKRIDVAFVMRGEEPRMVAMLEGDFRQSDLAEMMSLLQTPQGARDSEGFVSFVDATHVLIGDRAEVLRARERLKRPQDGLHASPGKPAGASIDETPLALTTLKRELEKPKFAVIHGMGPEPVLAPVH